MLIDTHLRITKTAKAQRIIVLRNGSYSMHAKSLIEQALHDKHRTSAGRWARDHQEKSTNRSHDLTPVDKRRALSAEQRIVEMMADSGCLVSQFQNIHRPERAHFLHLPSARYLFRPIVNCRPYFRETVERKSLIASANCRGWSSKTKCVAPGIETKRAFWK
jgi:hypothetical protein